MTAFRGLFSGVFDFFPPVSGGGRIYRDGKMGYIWVNGEAEGSCRLLEERHPVSAPTLVHLSPFNPEAVKKFRQREFGGPGMPGGGANSRRQNRRWFLRGRPGI